MKKFFLPFLYITFFIARNIYPMPMKYTPQYGPQPPKKETLKQRLLKFQTFLDRPETEKEERLRKLKFQMFYVKNEIDKKKLEEMYKKIENGSKTEVQKWLDGEF